MKPLAHPIFSSHATDVAQFFMDITEAYLSLERSILHLIHTLPSCTPEQILHECRKLAHQRDQLASLDRQMLSVIEVAGVEIVRTHMIQDYRVAFAKSLMASNTLHQKLLAVKVALQDAPAFS
ncbi:MAG TPA: hypothetical protein DDY32_17280 [Desulfobulbaceae bacterium]|nr:hypothetical protein [Desulfobulbaceae bacterium]